jgi:predicted permease
MSAGLVIRVLLRLYPERFRAEYGAAMAETYALRAAEARARGRWMVWFLAREGTSLATGALRERWGAWRAVRQTKGQRRRQAMTFVNALVELRHAARRLVRAPGFTLAVVLTLGLTIGATTAIYALVDAIIVRPLPYPESERLVLVDHGAAGLDQESGLGMSEGLYLQYRRNARTIESIGIHTTGSRNLTGEGTAERVRVTYVTPSIGQVLQVKPLLGRWFVETEGDAQWGPVVVLSEGFWRQRYGGDPTVLGRTITLSGTSHEVVGVMPASFAFPGPATSIWAPLGIDPATARVGGFNYGGIARLRDGVTAEQMRREVDGLIASVPAAFPDQIALAREIVNSARLFAAIQDYKESLIGGLRRTMWVLLGTMSVVLLIACANVANLFLVRAEGRRLEVAVRRALGASRARIAGNYLFDAVLLALLGGILGALLSAVGIQLLLGQLVAEPGTSFSISQMLPRLHELKFGGGVLGFAITCALITGVLFGSVPLLSPPDIAETVRDSGRRTTAGRGRFHARNVLVIMQIAMAFVLLVAGGLMIRSFVRLNRIDPGFDAENVLTFQVALSGERYSDANAESVVAFHGTMVERLEALPGVSSASGTTCIPLGGWCYGDPLIVEGRPRAEGTIPPVVNFRRVLPGYFETMRIPLRAGRGIEAHDQESRTGAVVISEELARLYFPGEDPIGRRIYFAAQGGRGDAPVEIVDPTAPGIPWFTVVGIIPNLALDQLNEDRRSASLYLPALHQNEEGPGMHFLTYVVRTSVPPTTLVPAVRSLLQELDPDVPLASARSMEDIVAASALRMSFTLVLLVIAAVAALLLGTIGIYGVISYLVSRRTSEIGIRLALGARPGQVTGMVVRHGARLAGIGVIAGIAGALLTTQLLQTLLYGVEPEDVATYSAVALLLGGIALLACWVPARRAAGMSPLNALRNE